MTATRPSHWLICFVSVSIVVFMIILAFSIWGGTQIQTPNHPPEIFPRDSNIQHFINLSYDFTSTERYGLPSYCYLWFTNPCITSRYVQNGHLIGFLATTVKSCYNFITPKQFAADVSPNFVNFLFH